MTTAPVSNTAIGMTKPDLIATKTISLASGSIPLCEINTLPVSVHLVLCIHMISVGPKSILGHRSWKGDGSGCGFLIDMEVPGRLVLDCVSTGFAALKRSSPTRLDVMLEEVLTLLDGVTCASFSSDLARSICSNSASVNSLTTSRTETPN
eukprot:Blabericola_migrator_1__6341@NODE_319_length_9881_cov_31_716324_g77_i1_p5_GENE_NODE_319_length_9881_cov_31_716324_g77_i1NODE_319_length_9881_cov_31_716324_g77_i1_p5_ORF_typecomplete_len151_score27_76_NODE_319_length_9881_cov_31_716324_g77_i156886140